MIRVGDSVILAAALGLLAGVWVTFAGGGGDAAVVHVVAKDGEARDFPLWETRRVRIDGPLGTSVIEIAGGKVRFLESPCRNKICVRSGWLDHAGESAACLPNRVSVTLLAGDPRFDAVNF